MADDFNRESFPTDLSEVKPASQLEDDQKGIVSSPQIDASGKPTRRAVKDPKQAKEIVLEVVQNNRSRNIVASRIMAKYNAERPYEQAALEREGLGWRQNFTTKPLPMMIEKAYPRFSEAVHGLKYLTNSALSDKWQNSAEKTERFRAGLTKVIRDRKGWRTLVEDIAMNNSLFGHSIVACLDEYRWMPKHFNHDESFITDGVKQTVGSAQVIVLREVYLPHELYEYIREPEIAKGAGWEVPNTIAAINNACPSQIKEMLSVGGTTETWYQNAERELNVGTSYQGGANSIQCYSLFVREVTGKVSHYRLAGTELNIIFARDDRFDTMDDCAAFFSFQKGNGTMHGSKGIGREIYELAGMQDRTRNEVVDRAILSGKTLVQGDIRQIHKFKMSVVGSTVIVPSGWTVLEQRVDGNIEPFLKLDAYFQMLVDQLVGSVSPKQFGGERTTAAEVNLYASREEEVKDSKITRFLEQFTDMVGLMQRRICNPDVKDEDAKAFQKIMLDIMTREELDELAKQPVAGTVRDLTPMQRQQVVAVAAEKRGNPLYNQLQLEKEDITARLDASFAKRVLLPENDPTQEAEQLRLQQMELALILQAQAVPVSPRDGHVIHMKVLMPVAQQVAQAVMQGQSNTAVFESVIAHLTEHYTLAEQQGAPKEALAEVAGVIKKAGPVLAKLKEVDAQAQQLAAQSQQLDAEDDQQMQIMQGLAQQGGAAQPPVAQPGVPA
jgi:hypothetical protein